MKLQTYLIVPSLKISPGAYVFATQEWQRSKTDGLTEITQNILMSGAEDLNGFPVVVEM